MTFTGSQHEYLNIEEKWGGVFCKVRTFEPLPLQFPLISHVSSYLLPNAMPT